MDGDALRAVRRPLRRRRGGRSRRSRCRLDRRPVGGQPAGAGGAPLDVDDAVGQRVPDDVGERRREAVGGPPQHVELVGADPGEAAERSVQRTQPGGVQVARVRQLDHEAPAAPTGERDLDPGSDVDVGAGGDQVVERLREVGGGAVDDDPRDAGRGDRRLRRRPRHAGPAPGRGAPR